MGINSLLVKFPVKGASSSKLGKPVPASNSHTQGEAASLLTSFSSVYKLSLSLLGMLKVTKGSLVPLIGFCTMLKSFNIIFFSSPSYPHCLIRSPDQDWWMKSRVKSSKLQVLPPLLYLDNKIIIKSTCPVPEKQSFAVLLQAILAPTLIMQAELLLMHLTLNDPLSLAG